MEQDLAGGCGQKLCLKSRIAEPLPERTGGPLGPLLCLFSPQCPHLGTIMNNWDSSAVTWGKGRPKSAQYGEPSHCCSCVAVQAGSEFPVGAVKAEAERGPWSVAGIEQQIWKSLF